MRKKRTTLTILGVCFLLVLAISAYADSEAYNGSVLVQKQTQNYIIIHSHDFSRSHRFRNEGIFTIVSKKDGVIIVKEKFGAITHIAASEKHDVIVLLSNVKWGTPYQLRIFTFSGEEIKKDSVSQESIGNKYGQVWESATNYVFWFSVSDPGFEFVEAEDELYLEMNDYNILCELGLVIENRPKPRFSIKIKNGINGQYDQAIADYNKDIEINPRDAVAYYNRGIAYGLNGQYGQAIADYTKAIELNPRLADAYYNRGHAYAKKGQYDKAISDYNEAIARNQKLVDAYYNRGHAYAKKGQYYRAISDYNKVIELNPKYATAYNNRGEAWGYIGNYDRAITDYTKSIELNPKLATAYNNRGIAWVEKGNFDRACLDLKNACELGSCRELNWGKKEGICK